MWLWKFLGLGKREKQTEPPAEQPPGPAGHDPELERILAEHDRRGSKVLEQMRLEQHQAEQEAEQARIERRQRLHAAGQILDGNWILVAAEVDGVPREDLKGERLVFDDEWAHFGPKYPMSQGGYVQDLTTSPKQITFERHNPQFVPDYFTIAFAQVQDPRAAPNVAITTTLHLAIYELEGDTLRLCGMGRDCQRPSEFRTTVGTGRYLFVYRREKF
jgi:uncharacterized protein (TIGR03067 family)